MKDGEIYVDTEDFFEEIVVSDEVLQSYVGDYEISSGFVITVSKDGKQLKAKASGREEYAFEPKSENAQKSMM